MNESRRGTKVVALTQLRHPSERIIILPRMEGRILHEIEENERNRHQIFVRWETGGSFYVFEEEVRIP